MVGGDQNSLNTEHTQFSQLWGVISKSWDKFGKCYWKNMRYGTNITV